MLVAWTRGLRPLDSRKGAIAPLTPFCEAKFLTEFSFVYMGGCIWKVGMRRKNKVQIEGRRCCPTICAMKKITGM